MLEISQQLTLEVFSWCWCCLDVKLNWFNCLWVIKTRAHVISTCVIDKLLVRMCLMAVDVRGVGRRYINHRNDTHCWCLTSCEVGLLLEKSLSTSLKIRARNAMQCNAASSRIAPRLLKYNLRIRNKNFRIILIVILFIFSYASLST